MIVARVRIEIYHSSVKEELFPLSEHILMFLNRQYYFSFFKSYGSNYIRNICRTQKITAIFDFTKTSTEMTTSLSV